MTTIENTCTVSLMGMEFYAYHGVYSEEQKVGNKYTIDVTLWLSTCMHPHDNLNQTVDYEKVYEIVSQNMKQPKKLLETIGHDITDQLLSTFIAVNKVSIHVSKHNPPIGGICLKAQVSVDKKR